MLLTKTIFSLSLELTWNILLMMSSRTFMSQLAMLIIVLWQLHPREILANEEEPYPENTESKKQKITPETLPEVAVKATKIKETGINPTQPITTITSEELERRQFSNIFEAVRSTPGVSITGGPRPSGMTFSIRGYSDNEDVMVKVDGVPKGFEKYRMGGTFIEPELLKSIEVQRGPQITSGSGSLGGTIIATTKNAADFLKPGQRYGAKIKFGYGNNNDEYSRSYMIYGRPHDRLDILYNYSNRQSNNIMLPSGTELESSAIQSVSKLLKVSIFPTDSLELVTSIVSFKDSGLQPYDATGGQPGTFGNVIRSIDDLTWSQTLNFTPDTKWINLKLSFGRGHTKLYDLIPPSSATNVTINPAEPNCNGITYRPNPALTSLCHGNINDDYTYNTKTIDLTNTSNIIEKSSFKFSALAGYQFNDSKRDIERLYDNPKYFLQSALYPNGFNASAPPGKKSFHAVFIQPKFEIGNFNITPGYRYDSYEVEAAGGTLSLLSPYNQKSKIRFNSSTVSLGLSYDFFQKNSKKKLTIYSNYGQGFRPPLIDEYFTQGPFSKCLRANVLVPGVTMVHGPESGICGNLYKPQRSESTEAGVSFHDPNILDSNISLISKINFFHIYTSKLLSSLRENSDGSITQNGWERRNGVEFESFVQWKSIYIRGSYSRISGKLFDGGSFVPLYTAPGNTTNINLGTEISNTFNINLSYRNVSQRNVIVAGGGIQPLVFGTQDGYEIWGAGMHWQPMQNLGFRLIGENLKNKEYRLDGSMGGLGMFAAGRNIKFIVEMTY